MLEEGNDVEETESVLCDECGGTSCYWEKKGVSIISVVEDYCNSEKIEAEDVIKKYFLGPGASTVRKITYRTYVGERYWFLGPGNSVRIPHCIKREKRRLWPDDEGN